MAVQVHRRWQQQVNRAISRTNLRPDSVDSSFRTQMNSHIVLPAQRGKRLFCMNNCHS